MRIGWIIVASGLLPACSDEGTAAAAASRVFVADERAGTLSVIDDGAAHPVTTVDLAEARDGCVEVGEVGREFLA